MPERLALLLNGRCFLPLKVHEGIQIHQSWMETQPSAGSEGQEGLSGESLVAYLSSCPGVSLLLSAGIYRMGSGHAGPFGTSPPARPSGVRPSSFFSGWRPLIRQSKR